MLEIGNTLVSLELIKEDFVCNLSACKGACCVAGDAGAPLELSEKTQIEQDIEKILDYLPEKGKDAIQVQGVAVEDPFNQNELVSPLVDGKECAFTVFDASGSASCGIELAWKDGKSSLRKPISCHLYPVRLKDYRDFTAVNYERWDICNPACALGKELKVPVYRFLKEPLIRRFGQDWYEALELFASGKN